jgi:acylphosphatase
MVFKMKRLTAYVSGKVQKAGYRARVVDIAQELGLKGFVKNLDDGRVKIIADGEDDVLGKFLKAIDIKNTVIRVDSISIDYSEATDIFDDFGKRVNKGETDSRLDDGIEILKGILDAIKDLGSKQDKTLDAIKDMHSDLGSKQDKTLVVLNEMNSKQDKTLDAIKDLGNKQDKTIEEIKGLREDVRPGLVVQIQNVQSDVRAIKDRLGMP